MYLKSNHANNPSDTGASQGKQQVKYYTIGHKSHQLKDEFDLAGVLDSRGNHKSEVISVYSQVNGVKHSKLKGIRKFHRFVYDLEKGILAFSGGLMKQNLLLFVNIKKGKLRKWIF